MRGGFACWKQTCNCRYGTHITSQQRVLCLEVVKKPPLSSRKYTGSLLRPTTSPCSERLVAANMFFRYSARRVEYNCAVSMKLDRGRVRGLDSLFVSRGRGHTNESGRLACLAHNDARPHESPLVYRRQVDLFYVWVSYLAVPAGAAPGQLHIANAVRKQRERESGGDRRFEQ